MSKENIWDFIISKCDIVNIIGQYVSLNKQGKNYKANCPFHSEKTPSFIVSGEKQFFKCFGCGKSGNVIKFIEFKENLNSIEALKFLAKKENLDISNFDNFFLQTTITSEQQKILDAMSTANNFFRYQLIFEKNAAIEAYLKKRNLSEEIIKEFELGYANSNKLIYDKLKEENIDDFAIYNSSLLSNYGNKNFFNDRLIFPIHDKYGNIVAFSGRDISDLQTPKYLNSAETIVFKKNEVMFNYFHAQEAINETNEVYLVEGQFDCIALYKIGIKNVVALMGTSFSINHLKELSNKNIILLFDNDEAGKNATFKNLKMILQNLKKYNLNVSFINNNLNKDPDELYNLDNGLSLKKITNIKIDIIEFLYNAFNEIFNKEANEINKLNAYETLFEYVSYLYENWIIALQERMQKANILSKDLFYSLLKKIKKSQANLDFYATFDPKKNSNAQFNEPKFDQYEIESFASKMQKKGTLIKQELKNKISVYHKTLIDFYIIVTSLSQDFFNKEFFRDFKYISFDDENKKLKKLVDYALDKKSQNDISSPKEIVSFLENDISNLENKDEISLYQEFLEIAKELQNYNQDSLFDKQMNDKDHFYKKYQEMRSLKNKNKKKFIS
ncbi:DNA primase [Metamycoplasma auris 15026]|uniref:DNA primase n=1 Tax=Metamycoplasma auris 15026 TaxID=1188233 RepID=N9V022_9BACT|nr:DNA primase [Metamycoplasma auris]ENY68757.1 DNA primase [Metamycoplasma auris 15026]